MVLLLPFFPQCHLSWLPGNQCVSFQRRLLGPEGSAPVLACYFYRTVTQYNLLKLPPGVLLHKGEIKFDDS